MNLKDRDFLKLLDYSSDEIRYLLELSKEFKEKKHNKVPHKYLEGKNIAIIFEKDSTRTRCSFEVAAYDLGMHVTYLGPTGSQMGKKESIEDTARVLCRIYDGIEYRGFDQNIVETLAKYSSVPVWNGLTNEFHPTQMLADFMTIEEEFGSLQGKKLVFCGDARNNVANSLMVASAKLGVNFVCCAPKDLWPEEELTQKCKEIAKENGITTAYDPNYSSLIATKEDAKEYFEEIIPFTDILFMSSKYDTKSIFDIESLENIVKYLTDSGIQTIIIKSSETKGYHLNYMGNSIFIPFYTDHVVDTTSSGDAFNGAFLHAIANSYTPIEAANIASIDAGLQAQGIGAIKSVPYFDEVYKIYKEKDL